jgi:outer membrane protein OmpA-like peptidoglycan-associated protein
MKDLFCKGFLLVAVFFCVSLAHAQSDAVRLSVGNTGAYTLDERSDWSRYDNGKYTGLTYRGVKASIIPKSGGEKGDLVYQGNFLVLEETRRDMRASAKAVNAVVPVVFHLNSEGNFRLEEDNGFPSLRGFPVFPAKKIKKGDKWISAGERAVDPLNTGSIARLPIVVEYEYRGIEDYKGTPVYRINAKYSSSKANAPVSSEADFTRAQGSHEVAILIRVSDGLPLLMRDQLDETFFLTNGSTVRFRGFTLTFIENIIPMDKGSIIAVITEPPPKVIEKPADKPVGKPAPPKLDSVDVVEVPEGVKLTIKNLRFKPDSDEFLDTERLRIDAIADALKQVPGRTFLVEGHTAGTGQPSSEMTLSIARAKRMVDELATRGIGADRFLFKGWGGTKPVGDNATDSGRAQNRRVEITILE